MPLLKLHGLVQENDLFPERLQQMHDNRVFMRSIKSAKHLVLFNAISLLLNSC